MDQNLDEDIRQVLAEVPPPIRAFFASGKIELITKVLMHEQGLHVDQAAVLEREIILLLLGLQSPTEFAHALESEGRIEQATVQVIAHEINAQIFIPLRDEMRRGGGASMVSPSAPPAAAPRVQAPPPSYGPPPPRPMPPPPPARPEQAFVPPPPPQSVPHISLPPMMQGAPMRVPAPPAPQPQPASAPSRYDISYQPPRAAAPLPPRTVLPGASAPVFHNPMPPPRGVPSAPANLPTGAPPTPHADPWAAQGTPGAEFPELPPLARPQSASSPLSSEAQPTAPHTRYPSDPYREPFDGG